MWFGEQKLTDKNNRAFMPTDPYRNRSRLSRLLVLQSAEYRDNVEPDLFRFGPSDRPTNHPVRRPLLAVKDELLHLVGLGKLAPLNRTVDSKSPVSQGFYQSGVRGLEDRFDVADVTSASAKAREVGNLLTHINMPSFRQICQTLVLAPGAHVCKRFLLKIGLQCQHQANTDKRIPSRLGLMVADDEL